MRTILCNHLRGFHLAFRLGFMLVVVLLLQGGRPSTADAVPAFGFEGSFDLVKSDGVPGGADVLGLLGTRFKGEFWDVYSSPVLWDTTGTYRYYLADSGIGASTMHLQVNSSTYGTLHFFLGDQNPTYVTVANNSVDNELGTDSTSDGFIFRTEASEQNPWVWHPAGVYIPAPGLEGYSTSGADLFLYDRTGTVFDTANPLGTVMDQIINNQQLFHGTNSIEIDVQLRGTTYAYVGSVDGIFGVPEPGTALLLGPGLLGVLAWRWRRAGPM